MFAIKKTQILIEFLDRTQKSFLVAKKRFLVTEKSFLGFRGFCTFFWEVDHSLCDVWKQKKTQILIAHLKEEIDWTQKSPAIRQKKFGKGLEDFVRVFGK